MTLFNLLFWSVMTVLGAKLFIYALMDVFGLLEEEEESELA